MLCENLVALARHWQNLNCPTSFWPRLARVRGNIHARATLPSPRLHGAARGLRARSAPRAATGACPTTIRDVLRVQSPPGAPHAARRAHFHPASPPLGCVYRIQVYTGEPQYSVYTGEYSRTPQMLVKIQAWLIGARVYGELPSFTEVASKPSWSTVT